MGFGSAPESGNIEKQKNNPNLPKELANRRIRANEEKWNDQLWLWAIFRELFKDLKNLIK
mgnify:FL=1